MSVQERRPAEAVAIFLAQIELTGQHVGVGADPPEWPPGLAVVRRQRTDQLQDRRAAFAGSSSTPRCFARLIRSSSRRTFPAVLAIVKRDGAWSGKASEKLQEHRERREVPRGALDHERDEHRRNRGARAPRAASRGRPAPGRDGRGSSPQCRTRGRDQRRDRLEEEAQRWPRIATAHRASVGPDRLPGAEDGLLTQTVSAGRPTP